MKNRPMKVSFDKNPYFLTKISGSNLEEIHKYCEENNLTIVDEYTHNTYGYIIQAEKPNQRMYILRKRVRQIEGWKLISDIPTPKMHWLTYEKISK